MSSLVEVTIQYPKETELHISEIGTKNRYPLLVNSRGKWYILEGKMTCSPREDHNYWGDGVLFTYMVVRNFK